MIDGSLILEGVFQLLVLNKGTPPDGSMPAGGVPDDLLKVPIFSPFKKSWLLFKLVVSGVHHAVVANDAAKIQVMIQVALNQVIA